MKNWVFLSPVFWRVLRWGLILDCGSKLLINLLIEPISFSRGSLSELVGKVYTLTPLVTFQLPTLNIGENIGMTCTESSGPSTT